MAHGSHTWKCALIDLKPTFKKNKIKNSASVSHLHAHKFLSTKSYYFQEKLEVQNSMNHPKKKKRTKSWKGRYNSAPLRSWLWLRLRFGFCAGISSKNSRLIGSDEIPSIAASNQRRLCIRSLVCCPLPLSGVGNDNLRAGKEGEDAPTNRATGLLRWNSSPGKKRLLD